jgi:NAD-dependent deacetylase
MAIANLQDYRHVSVVTQNIDGLHRVAGSRDLTELHGNIFATRCIECDSRGKIRDEFSDLPHSCKICGSYLRPDVVWFGEGINQEVWKQAVMNSITCDAMIIVGDVDHTISSLLPE